MCSKHCNAAVVFANVLIPDFHASCSGQGHVQQSMYIFRLSELLWGVQDMLKLAFGLQQPDSVPYVPKKAGLLGAIATAGHGSAVADFLMTHWEQLIPSWDAEGYVTHTHTHTHSVTVWLARPCLTMHKQASGLHVPQRPSETLASFASVWPCKLVLQQPYKPT